MGSIYSRHQGGTANREDDILLVPRHVAIIMDGNGRWAKRRGLPRPAGHRAGVRALREVVSACGELGIQYLTLYAFSTENWQRPAAEISSLMELLVESFAGYAEELDANKVRIKAIGRLDELPRRAREVVEESVERTAANDGLTVIFALNYGGRREIVDAVRAIAEDVLQGRLRPAEIGEETIHNHLYTGDIPDPDLLIRPSGEMRLSNFLLWQTAYTEIWITKVLWPDFGRKELLEAVYEFQRRERRFGGLQAQSAGPPGENEC